MNFSFREEATAEYEEALRYYFAIDPKLSRQFVSEIEAAIALICERPLLRPVVGRKKIRRYLVSRFSFGIYYVIENDLIVIWAIMHQSRNPARWRNR